MVDGAQSLAHFKINVQELDVDFFAISGHKTFAPTGVGAIYIKEKYLKDVKPYQTGGATIHEVDYSGSILLDSPYKFEAGTQNIAGVIGFGKALEYINTLIKLNPNNHEAIFYQAYCCLFLKDYKKSIQYLQIANRTLIFMIFKIHHDD